MRLRKTPTRCLDNAQLLALSDEPVSVQFDNRIGPVPAPSLRFAHPRRIPRPAVTPFFFSPAARHLGPNSGRDAFALQIFDRLDGRIRSGRPATARDLWSGFCCSDFADDMHVAGVFRNPIRACQADVQKPVLDALTADFLGAN